MLLNALLSQSLISVLGLQSNQDSPRCFLLPLVRFLPQLAARRQCLWITTKACLLLNRVTCHTIWTQTAGAWVHWQTTVQLLEELWRPCFPERGRVSKRQLLHEVGNYYFWRTWMWNRLLPGHGWPGHFYFTAKLNEVALSRQNVRRTATMLRTLPSWMHTGRLVLAPHCRTAIWRGWSLAATLGIGG